MSFTKITNRVIEPGTITADLLAPGVGGGPAIANVQIANSSYTVLDDTAVSLDGGYIIINGENFEPNVQVLIGNTVATSVTYVSSTEVRAEVGLASAGSKIVYLVNTDTGATAIRVNGLTYSGTPTWVTGSTLPQRAVDEIISIQLNATSDSNVSYSLASGSSLPEGLTLSANGLLSGTITGISDDTTYNFTIEATDEENQESLRTFSLTIVIVVNSTHGWWGGGSGSVSIIDRITFADDTVTASVRGPLSVARQRLSATGNKDFGWFGGGGFPVFTTVDRITFASDTDTAPSRGPLSLARHSLAATGNDNFGWFGGGNPGPVSRVDRIDFAADTATASIRGPLSSIRGYLAATGNDDFGWFGGGLPNNSTVDRITFASDTGTAPSRGPLSLARSGLAATGNDNFGWFGGGTPGPVSRVDRIDFAADTATASIRGPLSSVRYRFTGAGNLDYGWFGANGFPTTSTVDRITFAADTATASVRGPLSAARYSPGATAGII